jgi:magnesium transporter
MPRYIKKGNISWINIIKPTAKDLQFLADEYNLHPIVLEELVRPSARAKVEQFDSYLYFIYHLPIYDSQQKTSRRGEINFIITKDALISVSYERLEPVELFVDKLDRDNNYKETILGGTTARLLYYLLDFCLSFAFRELKHIDDKIEMIRKNLFCNQEKQLLEDISYTKRDILSFYLCFQPQQGVFRSLSIVGPNFWGPETQIYFSDLEGDYLRILQYCTNYKETIESFEETNTQLLNIKMNSVMEKFTVLAFLTFPLVLLTSVYQTGLITKPHITNNLFYDFWIEFGIITVLTLILLKIFKKKGWF